MNEQNPDLGALDELIEAHPPAGPPLGFTQLVMERLDTQVAAHTIWHREWVQWLAVGIGLALTIGRLLGYIFSAWLSVEVSG